MLPTRSGNNSKTLNIKRPPEKVLDSIIPIPENKPNTNEHTLVLNNDFHIEHNGNGIKEQENQLHDPESLNASF